MYPAISKWLRGNSDSPKNRWFESSLIKVYLRKYHRRIDLSNVVVTEHFQRQGIYTEFVDWLYVEGKRFGYTSVKHENVLNECLIAFHTRRGLTLHRQSMDDPSPSFIKTL